MNRIKDPYTGRVSIVTESKQDKQICRRALGAAQVEFAKVQIVDRATLSRSLELDISEEIARGLADIALGEYGERGFSGLTQLQADEQLTRLSGDVGDFIDDLLGDPA